MYLLQGRQTVTIEDIRQCLIDRDTRIRQSFEFEVGVYPHVSGLTIDSGFLADQELHFHEGLNSIVGAKGIGKSLAIEFLRFTLDQPPTSKEVWEDHDAKIDKCLKLHGQVQLVLADESGKKYQVTRTYNPVEGKPVEILTITH